MSSKLLNSLRFPVFDQHTSTSPFDLPPGLRPAAIKHHGEEYLDQAKGLQAKASLAMSQVVQSITVAEPKTRASTEHLATLNKLLKSPGRPPKSTPQARRLRSSR